MFEVPDGHQVNVYEGLALVRVATAEEAAAFLSPEAQPDAAARLATGRFRSVVCFIRDVFRDGLMFRLDLTDPPAGCPATQYFNLTGLLPD